MNVLLILGVFVILVIVFGQLLRHVAVGKLSCVRSFSKKAVFEGETGEMVEVVSNNSWMIVPWLRIESRVSPHLVFGSLDNLDMIGRMYHKSIFTLMPYQRTKRRRYRNLDVAHADFGQGDGFASVHTTRLLLHDVENRSIS